MNLALPAPRVEAAIAPPVEYAEPATAEMARPSHSMTRNMIQPPPIVEPAIAVSGDADTDMKSSNPLPPPPVPKQVPPLSVEGLRMAPGINHFESDAAILPRAPSKNIIQLLLPCLYDDRHFATYGEVKKYCFIKDTVCYVYNDRTDPQPLYQISLLLLQGDTTTTSMPITAVMEDRYHPDRYSTTISPQPDTNLPRPEMKTVLLLRTSSPQRLLYQFTFDTSVGDSTVADRFLSIVQSITRKV
jgi:hypothetical protein